MMTDKISKHFFRAGKVLSQIFQKNVSISVAKMDMKRLRLDHWWSSTYQKIHMLLAEIFPNKIFDSFTIKMGRKFSRWNNEKVHIIEIIGGSQNWFRDLPKFSNIRKIFRSSCSASKIMPSYEIWVHGLVPEPKNRIRHFQNIDWDKYPLKSKFSKTNGTIVISVQRSSGFSIFMQK